MQHAVVIDVVVDEVHCHAGRCIQCIVTMQYASQALVATNLVDPASSHMLVSKIKPCMSQYKFLYGETANGSLKQL